VSSELRWLIFDGEQARLEKPLARNIRDYALSPNGRYLVFSGLDNDITLLELATGKKRVLVASPSACLSWSPQSARFTYTTWEGSPGLYAYELATGRRTKIVGFPCGTFSNYSSGGTPRYCGEVTCGVWLDESHVLFQRFTGSLPDKVTVTIAGDPIELRAQHTTIAALAGGKAKLVNWPARWYEIGRCAHGPYVLLTDQDPNTPPCVSPVFTRFAGFQPRPLAELEHMESGSGASFADPDCNILVRHERGYGDRWVSLVAPDATEVVFTSALLPTKFVTADGKQYFGDWGQSYAWVGDTGQHVMAITKSSENGTAVTLVDLDTGAFRILIEGKWHDVNVLAWTPRP
jgi:WD40 repeat protein